MVADIFRRALCQEHQSSVSGLKSGTAKVLRARVLQKAIYVQLAAFCQYLSTELLRQSGMDDRQRKDIGTAEVQHQPRPHLGSLELVHGRQTPDSKMKALRECIPQQCDHPAWALWGGGNKHAYCAGSATLCGSAFRC